MDETELERQISYAAMRLTFSETREERRAAFDKLAELHKLRSSEMIERLEREQGLR